jgi:hypothetical protein
MSITITLDTNAIATLDLSAAKEKIADLSGDKAIAQNQDEQQLQFAIDYKREADDPRELSEIPEIRLWFIRLDAAYPWLPFFLDWKSGELARYTAMLVPHQFSRSEGIIYNPEALEIYVMQKIFVLSNWCQEREISATSRLKSFAQLFGYDIDDSFFEQLM